MELIETTCRFLTLREDVFGGTKDDIAMPMAPVMVNESALKKHTKLVCLEDLALVAASKKAAEKRKKDAEKENAAKKAKKDEEAAGKK